jgi:site-specific recombinase XerD
MASVRTRQARDGSTTYAVLYRVGKKQSSRAFTDSKSAEKFKTLCDVLGPMKAIATIEADGTGALTLDQLAAEFFDWKKRDVELRTIKDYRRDYANWIQPRLGHRVAETVDELDVQQLVDHMATRLDAKSVGDRHMILHSIYKYGSARSRRLVTHNPCLETQMPKRTKKPPKGVPLPAWFALRAHGRDIEPDALDLAEFIVATGWRWSEAAALTIEHVDCYFDDDGTDLTVATMGNVMRAGQVVPGAKSRAGFRASKVPEPAASIVRRRMVGKGPTDLIFTNDQGRKWYQQNFLNRTWPRILRAAGLPDDPGTRYTPHQLRHTQPMLLNRAGATPAEMQRRMGHESITTTLNVYGGMIDDIPNDVLAKVSALLSDASPVIEGSVVSGELVSGDTTAATPR